MAENFAKFAGMYVPYKYSNIYYNRGYGDQSKYKFNHGTATLVGVGVSGNTEHFILQKDYGGRIAIHYRYITWPL